MPSIRAVLFDFGGVFTDSPFVALDRLGEELGADPQVLMEVIFGPYHEDTEHPWPGSIPLLAAVLTFCLCEVEMPGEPIMPMLIFMTLIFNVTRRTTRSSIALLISRPLPLPAFVKTFAPTH